METKRWQPTASIDTLKKRANIIKKIRAFFHARDVLEVETPLLSQGTTTDPNLNSFSLAYFDKTYYLQTSPEFHMKRLLAAGSGSIFQISKAFRYEACGHQHNPEFTMLEWYRVGFDHHDLMQEINELLKTILDCQPADKITYSDMFKAHLNIDPLSSGTEDFKSIAKKNNLNIDFELDHDGWLNLLMSYLIEPKLGKKQPVFVYNYPASQSALAKLDAKNLNVAERFEVYFKGVELANGFHELTDAAEQRRRFEADLIHRKKINLPAVPIDNMFLQALIHGLPDCAGVALGVDRLVKLCLGYQAIKEVMSFYR